MGHLGVPGLAELPAPSSLLTTWWSQEQLLSPHPAGLYRGRTLQIVSERSVGRALERLELSPSGSSPSRSDPLRSGPFRPTAVHRGMFTWDVLGEAGTLGEGGRLVTLRLPRALDEPDERGRSRSQLPQRMAGHARSLRALGLTRYLGDPGEVILVDGSLPALVSPADEADLPLTFTREGLRVGLPSGSLEVGTALGWTAAGDASLTAELMTEVVAALVYHYQPDVDGGAAITDVSFNDGDFCVRRPEGGPLELRLQVVRHIDGDLRPEVLLLHLLQLHAYERVLIGDDELGLPLLISNPAIAFAGLVRGWQKRALDLGLPEQAAEEQARSWIQRFSRSPEGRAYRPWAEHFLQGRLPASFGDDLREGRFDLGPMRQRQHVLSLAGRCLGRADRAQAAAEFAAFTDGAVDRAGPAPAIANPEHFGSVRIVPEREAQALAELMTFEEYMDLCLHDPAWGYYGHRVQIGRRGHFDTHPEALSPHYGAWLAERALGAWQDLLAGGELESEVPFVMVEFGAGNGRLARDVLDAVTQRAEATGDSATVWQAFRKRLEYRIYELSVALGDKQRALLGADAVVALGDARCPQECLRRDFPQGLRGLIVTNEVPDALGAHKVLLPLGSGALAALVLPRLDAALRATLPAPLAERIQGAHARIAQALDVPPRAGEEFLDRGTFRELMAHLAEVSDGPRAAALGGLWFEEVYVRAEAIPALSAHLSENASAYAQALSDGPGGLSMYVNVHASDFIRGLGQSLAAGFVLTIDYGGSTLELARTLREGRLCFRVYGSTTAALVPRANDPYSFPGTQDLTADVNFTDLAHAGRAVGLEVIHYGPETDLVGSSLPEVLAAGDGRYGALLGEFGFKLLVQGTRKSAFFQGAGLTPLPLD